MSFRTYGRRPSWGEYMTPAIMWLLIANTAVFFLELLIIFFNRNLYSPFIKIFGLIPDSLFFGLRIWQPFTYLFVHDGTGISHWFWNMLTLWMFGRDLERAWGTVRFLKFYLLVGAGAGLLNAIAALVIDPSSQGAALVATIGASGAIYGVLMACAILFPDRPVALIFPPVVLLMKWFVFIWGLLAFFGTLMPGMGGVSHFTHLSGMAVAYFYLRRGSFLYKLRNSFTDWKRARARRKFEVYMQKKEAEDRSSHPDNWIN